MFYNSILLAFLLTIFVCEYGIYYIVMSQCSWPKLDEKAVAEGAVNKSKVLKAMLIADTHLLGPYRGHWFDKLRREWQMYRAFQTSITLYDPEVVFVLGDLFDEGQHCTDEQFQTYVDRFADLFAVPKKTRLYVVPGNHDLGFHYRLRFDLLEKFNSIYKTSIVQFKNLKGNYFVMINSMALHGDDCDFCRTAERELHKIAKKLNCLKNGDSCDGMTKLKEYSRPIVLQHFPMFRESDSICNERDEAPKDIKNDHFSERWMCLSKESSEMIYDLLNPRLIFGGHIHHGCKVLHRKDILEYTLSSYSWRNKNNPTFLLAVFAPNNHAIMKCDLPAETTVISIYAATVVGCILYLALQFKHRRKKLN